VVQRIRKQALLRTTLWLAPAIAHDACECLLELKVGVLVLT
jgi:hypothetical protein